MDPIKVIREWIKTPSGAFITSLIATVIVIQICKDYTQLIPGLYWVLMYQYLREEL